MKPPFRMIDLFAGCGGLTSGFVSAGDFHPVGAVELDPDAAATYAVNFGEHVFVGDIAHWLTGSVPFADVVVGGPPCQGFSSLGRRDPNDPRSALWDQYVEALVRIRPAFFVLENVPQFLRSPQYAALKNETGPGGRLTSWELEPYVLNASHYGVAQARRRAVVIGRRSGLDEIGPPPGSTPQLTLSDVLRSPNNFVEPAVTGIQLPESSVDVNGMRVPGTYKMAELHLTRSVTELSRRRFECIPTGGNRYDLPDELKTPCWRSHTTGSGDVMGRLVWNKPSVTIRTEFFKPEKGRYLHPEEHRPITHYEAALIQGFPEDFLWCGTKVSIARQIGNAVPPPMARAIADYLLARLL